MNSKVSSAMGPCAAVRGFSLIELMIAMAIGLILTAAVGNTFISSKTSYRLADAQARLQENGRYAIRAMARDIREAGFRGCGTRSETFVLNNVLRGSASLPWNFSQAVEGYEAVSSTSWHLALDTSIANPDLLGGRDILSIHRTVGATLPVQAHATSVPPGSNPVGIPSGNRLQQYDVVMVSDCVSGAVFQVTNADPQTGSLSHTPGSGRSGNASQALGREFGTGEVSRVSTVSYFVRTGVGGGPALWRVEGEAVAEELVEGVEDMQVLYGEDTNGDIEVDRYVAANAVSQWVNVLSVRISLLLHSIENNVTDKPQRYRFNGNDVTPADRRLRRVFSATVNLRNKVI